MPLLPTQPVDDNDGEGNEITPGSPETDVCELVRSRRSPVIVSIFSNTATPPPSLTREEYKAYGRTFVGSGQHDDYDAMTKLGEVPLGGSYLYHFALSAHSLIKGVTGKGTARLANSLR